MSTPLSSTIPARPPSASSAPQDPNLPPAYNDKDCLSCRLIGGGILVAFGGQMTYEGRKHFRLAKMAGKGGTGALAMGGLGIGMMLLGVRRLAGGRWRAGGEDQEVQVGA
ncbi:hypothetical protein DACRYDRAFT_113507 [Dacryopinax primogenitus]|uniref:DUF4536 domain-containing protein n=1 Tax=Dacryopinax primogenitus (strain DJM 731) TaxID=1858805 RepID=M5G526_DACPD|nr:uncharacterized protein DACRYDRAFT_113507 [Dacryopinax primogenitus]EJU05366.1 hypothetical protein DACRYDRAFT_113507 [Dacryopinax primogenitus]